MVALIAVFTVKPNDVLLFSTIKSERFPLMSEIFHLRLKYFISCSDINERVPAIEFALNSIDLISTENDKIFRVVDTLVDIGCNLDEYSDLGLTPLQGYVLFSNSIATEYLLDKGANPYLKAIDGVNVLIEATPVTEYTGLDSFDLSKKQINQLQGKIENGKLYKEAIKISSLLKAKKYNKAFKSPSAGTAKSAAL